MNFTKISMSPLFRKILVIAAGFIGLGFSTSAQPTEIVPGHRFGEVYLYGMVIFAPGGGTIRFPDGRPPISSPTKEIHAPIGATITTLGSETARLSFECGSIAEMGENSRVVIRSWDLELQQGSCRIRHVGTKFPMKVGGVATLTIQQDSLLEASMEGDSLAATVQAGRIKVLGLAEEVSAGEKIIAAGSVIRRAVFVPTLPPEISQRGRTRTDVSAAPDPLVLQNSGSDKSSSISSETERHATVLSASQPVDIMDPQKILEEKQVNWDD